VSCWRNMAFAANDWRTAENLSTDERRVVRAALASTTHMTSLKRTAAPNVKCPTSLRASRTQQVLYS